MDDHHELRENPSMSNLNPNRKKPPVHGYRNPKKNIDIYNPAAEMNQLPHVPSTHELGHGRQPHNRMGIHGGHHNMAYVNISSDGAKPVGPIGLKRAEKELIMRRYKYNHHHPNDNINRVALIYGQQHPQYNSHDRQYLQEL